MLKALTLPARALEVEMRAKERSGAVELTRLYRLEEIAEFAGVSRRQVQRWTYEGAVGFVKLPQGRRVSGKQYMEFVESRAHAAEEE